MKVVSLGVGEAFDEDQPNNSHLIISDSVILLDCGSTVPPQLWKYTTDPSFIDAVYISHMHADHYFGLPAVLVTMAKKQRTKPLIIICQKGMQQAIENLMEYGYHGWLQKLSFPLEYQNAEPNQTIKLNKFEITFAPTIHPTNNLAIKISDGKTSICYSGDGQFVKETEQLYHDADLVIHESYLFDEKLIGHSSIQDVIEMAKRNNVKSVALTHIEKDLRKNNLESIKKELLEENIRVLIPNPFDEIHGE